MNSHLGRQAAWRHDDRTTSPSSLTKRLHRPDPSARAIPHALFATGLHAAIKVHCSGSDRGLWHSNWSLRHNKIHARLKSPSQMTHSLCSNFHWIIRRIEKRWQQPGTDRWRTVPRVWAQVFSPQMLAKPDSKCLNVHKFRQRPDRASAIADHVRESVQETVQYLSDLAPND